MKLGMISPVPLLKKYSSRFPLQYIYCTVALDKQNYKNYYKNQSLLDRTLLVEWSPNLPRGSDKSFDPRAYRRIVNELHPSLVVIPSKDYDYLTTIESAIKFCASSTWKDYPIGNYIGLIQGTNEKEILECYSCYRQLGISNIGLASPLELVILRRDLIKVLNPISGIGIYFIETYADILSEIPTQPVRGFCTSFPIRLGLEGRTISDWGPTPPPLDFNKEEDSTLIEDNVEDWSLLCDV